MNRVVWKTVHPFLSVLFLLVLLGSCQDNPFGSRLQEEMAVLRVSTNVAGTSIRAVVVEVTAADIPTPLVFNLEVAEGIASGMLRVPLGAARTFHAFAYDSGGELTHEGSHTADLRRGENPPIEIVLVPRSGEVPIIITLADYSVEVTPAEASLEVGDTLRLRATIRDAEGQLLVGQVRWATLNPALAVVSREGLISARHTGTVQIVASYAGVVGTARLTIAGEGFTSGQIAFVSESDTSHSEIYIVNADGSGLVNLTNHPAADHAPAWSPDGSRIAFVSTRDSLSNIYTMNADGSNVQRLTYSRIYDVIPHTHLAWSPDGDRIAFMGFAFVGAADWNFDIFVINADGSDQVNVSNHRAHDQRPIWSPDGSRIAFVSNRAGSWQIFVANADGSNLYNLSSQPVFDQSRLLAWSPDGSRIAFMGIRDGNSDVYVINVDGSNLANLTNHPASDGPPAWSPDGSRIAFQSARDGNWQIYVMDADGSNPRRLHSDAIADAFPEWSPDGSRIAFMRHRDGNAELYVMNADGSNQRRLTNTAARKRDHVWRP